MHILFKYSELVLENSVTHLKSNVWFTCREHVKLVEGVEMSGEGQDPVQDHFPVR